MTLSLLKRIFIFSIGLLSIACTNSKVDSPSIESKAKAIVDAIVVPTFPDRVFNVLDYGAKSELSFDSLDALTTAIGECSNAGGGQVLIPSGEYYLGGPIHLQSNVNLHLEEGAQITFSTVTSDYMPLVHTSFEGIELMNFSPLIYAYQVENIAITGKGVFNGGASNEHWWPWAGKGANGYVEGMNYQRDDNSLMLLHHYNEIQNPVEERLFGEGAYLRPTFFEPFESKNILVQGVTFTNAPFWILHPFRSENITVDGVTVSSHGPNNDGCDPEYSKNVHIINCVFDTGDDCIAIKSGRNADGRRVAIPSENIVVENCQMKDGHGGVVMGSEISAGVKNVFVLNCQMDSPNLDRAIRIKSNTIRGGFVKGLYVKNIQVGEIKEAVLRINTHYGIYKAEEGNFYPEFDDIYLEDITVKNGGKYGLLIEGREERPVGPIHLKNIQIEKTTQAPKIEFAPNISFENVSISGKAFDTTSKEK